MNISQFLSLRSSNGNDWKMVQEEKLLPDLWTADYRVGAKGPQQGLDFAWSLTATVHSILSVSCNWCSLCWKCFKDDLSCKFLLIFQISGTYSVNACPEQYTGNYSQYKPFISLSQTKSSLFTFQTCCPRIVNFQVVYIHLLYPLPNKVFAKVLSVYVNLKNIVGLSPEDRRRPS